MNWFYAKNGSQQGPLSTDEIKSRIAMGEIGSDDLAWSEGMSDWMPIQQIPQLKIEAPASKEAPPPVMGAPSQFPSPTPYQTPASPASPAQMIPGQAPSQGMAIASMVCGIVGLILCCTGYFSAAIAITAVALGHVAISRNKQNPVANGGKGMARAGLILGYLGLLFSILMIGLDIWVKTLSPQEVEDKIISIFPEEMRQQMRERIETEKAKQQNP
jgi:hypothetical protein